MSDQFETPDNLADLNELPGQRRFQSSDPSGPLSSKRIGATSPPALIIAQAIRTVVWVGILVLFLWLTLSVDLIIFAGVVLAICLRRAANRVSAFTRIPVGGALALVVLSLLAFFAGIGWFFSQAIASQIDQLSHRLPAAAAKVGSIVGQSSVGKVLMEHLSSTSITQSPVSMLQNFFGGATNAVEVVGAIAIIMFLGLYFAAEANLYTSGLARLVPPAHRARGAEILHETASAIWYWMLGRLVSMTTLGVLVAIGLWTIHVPLPVALGFLAGILTFVPYIGAIVSVIPSLLLAVSVNPQLAVYVVLLYLAVHFVEAYILVPLVQHRVLHLPPALTLSAQILLGVIAGFLGLLLATPLVAVALVIIRMVYVEDVLGDRPTTEPAPLKDPPSSGDPGTGVLGLPVR